MSLVFESNFLNAHKCSAMMVYSCFKVCYACTCQIPRAHGLMFGICMGFSITCVFPEVQLESILGADGHELDCGQGDVQIMAGTFGDIWCKCNSIGLA